MVFQKVLLGLWKVHFGRSTCILEQALRNEFLTFEKVFQEKKDFETSFLKRNYFWNRCSKNNKKERYMISVLKRTQCGELEEESARTSGIVGRRLQLEPLVFNQNLQCRKRCVVRRRNERVWGRKKGKKIERVGWDFSKDGRCRM